MHLKRQEAPKIWPIPKKGTKYVVRPNFGGKEGIPLIIVLRDILKFVKNRREVRRALRSKNIFINDKPIKDENNSLLLFDVLKIVPLKKIYRIEISENKKISLKEIKESESHYKIAKVINKRIIKGGKVQINLSDGRNFISDVKCNTNDSVVINFNNKKIEKCLPLNEKAEVFIFSGKHAGKLGVVTRVDKKNKMASVKIGKDKNVNILIKQVIVVG